jgi:cyclohexanecarboxylate-CoA ligase
MPRGLSFEQIGVTDAMLASYGDYIWEHSNNVQTRYGDPVRMLQFDAIERQRNNLTDQQMAQVLGLRRDQVLQIRVTLEARSYHRHRYARLYELGGHRRFRADRFVPHELRDRFRPEAMALRNALRYDPSLVRKYTENGYWADDTLTKWLSRNVAHDARRPVVSGPSGELSYAELADKSERFARGLRLLDIRAGDVVSVQLPNIPEFFIAYMAIARLGAVMSTVHMPYRAAEIHTLLRHNRGRVYIGLSRWKDCQPVAEVLALQGSLPTLDHVIALGDPVSGTKSFTGLFGSEPDLPRDASPVPADPFLLLFTSGTSSSPKAVPLTYQMALGNARMSAPEHGLRADDLILSAAPYTHLFGLYSIHLAMSVGAGNLLLPQFSPPELLAAIEHYRPTALFTAPDHLAALENVGLLQSGDFSSLRLVVVSGSACPARLARAVAARLPNGALTQLWGMTELQAGLFTRPGDSVDVAGSGRPSPGAEVRIADPEDAVLPAGLEGELQIRGGLLFSGYFQNDEANRGAFTPDGWFRTGDLATTDAAGNVQITGRTKEIINRGGVKYNPADVEDLIGTHPKVLQAAVVAFPDPVLGEKACCFLVAKGGASPTLRELCAYLTEHGVSKVKLPERLEIIDSMPMTPTRKIIKAQLRERLRGVADR